MKTLTSRFLLPVGVIFMGLWITGCYTQLGTVEEERGYAHDVEEAYGVEDTVSTEEYEQARTRFYNDYYDYYYPSVMVGVGFYAPWYWRHNAWYAYDPFWYDPFWGWCGSCYPRYYAGWYGGWYGGWYNDWYPGAYYGHGPVSRGGSGYVAGDGGRYGATRTFGSTRTAGAVRGGSGSAYTPSTNRSATGNAPSALPTGRVSTGARGKDTGRGGEAVDKTSTRSGGTRNAGVRREAPRSVPRPESGTRTNRSGERYSPPPSSGNSGSSGGSYSPGSSRPSGSSSGSQGSSGGSRGSSAPSNTGDRGGNRR